MAKLNQLLQTLLQRGEIPADRTENMLSSVDLWKRYGGLSQVYPNILADIYMDSKHNSYVDSEGNSHPIVVFAKDQGRGEHTSIFLLDNPEALKVFMEKAREGYNFDIEEVQKNRNLPPKKKEMLSASDLKKEFGGRDEKYKGILEKIYQNSEQNTYIGEDGKKYPMVEKVKNAYSQPILCISNPDKALKTFLEIVEEKYNWDISGMKAKKEIPPKSEENLSARDLNKIFTESISSFDTILESIYKNRAQNQFRDSKGEKYPIVVLRTTPRTKNTRLFHILNDTEALDAFLQVAQKEYNMTFVPRQEISMTKPTTEKGNFPLKAEGMLSSVDLAKEFGQGGISHRYADVLETIYQDPDRNVYKDSEGKEHPIIVKVRNRSGNTFLCVSNEKGALRHFMKEFGNLSQKGREELRSSLREMTSTGNRRIISKMLSESTRFRKKLATGLRDFLKKQSQEKENASERLNVENKQRGILRKRLREATSETEKSSLVQQLTSDTPERKKRSDELHNLRAKNDEYIAVSAKLQELQKKHDEYLKVRSDLKKKSR